MQKIDYAISAAQVFISHLHDSEIDRGMIATFGNSFRVERAFSGSEYILDSSLRKVRDSFSRSEGEGTRLYDSIEDIVKYFWACARKQQPWVLIVITDGKDNRSTAYPPTNSRSAVNIGYYIADQFNHEPSNHAFLLGVGDNQHIDGDAICAIGDHGRLDAYSIDGFHLLEQEFLRIATEVSIGLYGEQVNYGQLSWDFVREVRSYSRIGIDYAFLLDRSGSMSEPG